MQHKGKVPQAPMPVKIFILAMYLSSLLLNAYAVWQWSNLDTMRFALSSWISLYLFETSMVFFPGWLSSPWVVNELILHHLVSSAFLGLVVAMPPCVNQAIVVRAMGVWMLINWNESLFILTDVVGADQRHSCLSIARRACLPPVLFIESPVITALVNYHLSIGIKTGSLDPLSLALSLCILILMNAFTWVYYPYVGYRCVKSLQRTYAGRRIGADRSVGVDDIPSRKER